MLIYKPCADDASCTHVQNKRVVWVQRPSFSQCLPDGQKLICVGQLFAAKPRQIVLCYVAPCWGKKMPRFYVLGHVPGTWQLISVSTSCELSHCVVVNRQSVFGFLPQYRGCISVMFCIYVSF